MQSEWLEWQARGMQPVTQVIKMIMVTVITADLRSEVELV